MPLGGPPEAQLVLLPARTATEAAVWGSTLTEYAAAYETVAWARDPALVDWTAYQAVTILDPAFWPAELPVLIKQANPTIRLDLLHVSVPEAVRAMLHVRVYFGWRYGPQTDKDWAQVWPAAKALIGLHGRTTGEMTEADYAVMRAARIEAVKVTSHAPPETLQALRQLDPKLFLMVRPMAAFWENGQPRRASAADFVSWTEADLRRVFQAAPQVQYVEIHNEPNLTLEGLSASWADGKEFGDWFLAVLHRYRELFPGKLFGFPGLSPGPANAGVGRTDPDVFLQQALPAALEADWIGVHSYWVNDSEMADVSLGLNVYRYRELFPEKLLFITEFGNPWAPPEAQARQYAQYYGMLRRMPGLGAVFAYVVSSATPGEANLAWRDENGTDRGVAALIGQRAFIYNDDAHTDIAALP